MSTNDPDNRIHPQELLEAYALDALDEQDEAQVESHLTDCLQCSHEVAELQTAAAQLGQSVDRRVPPPALQVRLMAAVDALDARALPAQEVSPRARLRVPVLRLAVPMAAAMALGLFTVAIVMNIRVSDRVDNLTRENSTLTAQVAISADGRSQTAETLRQLKATSYWLANPANSSLILQPPSGAGNSRGVLLVADDGHRAVLMLTGMVQQSPDSAYQVWLVRQGDRVLAGVVKVDDGGWGTARLQPKESLFRFDKVALTMEAVSDSGGALGQADLVLEGNIPADGPVQMVILPHWPVQ